MVHVKNKKNLSVMRFDETFKLGTPVPTHLWMVDIDGYSKVVDPDVQEELIKCLFGCVYDSVNEVSIDILKSDDIKKKIELGSDDATVIWTGDGAIVAVKSPFDLLTPLKLTYYFNKKWTRLDWLKYRLEAKDENSTPKVHMAVHSGECRWLKTPTLRSPLFEVSNCFGVDINLLARIATFSTSNGDFVASKSYAKKLNLPKENSYILPLSDASCEVQFTKTYTGKIKGKNQEKFSYKFFTF